MKEISVVYRGVHDSSRDDELCSLAVKHKGQPTDAGYFLGDGGERDMQFEFEDKVDAQAFVNALPPWARSLQEE